MTFMQHVAVLVVMFAACLITLMVTDVWGWSTLFQIIAGFIAATIADISLSRLFKGTDNEHTA